MSTRRGGTKVSHARVADRAAVEAALTKGRGNMTTAARTLVKDRWHLYRIVRRLGLNPERFRGR